ncbi:MAG: hypothetical protein J0H94_11955 [Rhizobiales bacterium]|nr:hypothetical protein [Hyphomicrobiales bacterium]
MKPTVGRIVHFYRRSPGAPEPSAAIITKVHSDTIVNLMTFPHDGNPNPSTPMTTVALVEPDQAHALPVWWMWPEIARPKKEKEAETK